MLARPTPAEYATFYAAYIAEISDGDILDILETTGRETQRLLAAVGETRGDYRYAPEKWSLKQVIGHLCDAERVFAFRALAFVRNDPARLPSMEQDDYMQHANFDHRSLRSIADELASVRAATLSLFHSIDGDMWLRRGTANNVEFTVRAMPYIIAGHELHHMGVVREHYLHG